MLPPEGTITFAVPVTMRPPAPAAALKVSSVDTVMSWPRARLRFASAAVLFRVRLVKVVFVAVPSSVCAAAPLKVNTPAPDVNVPECVKLPARLRGEPLPV